MKTTRLSLRKNRPILYQHLVSYVYQLNPNQGISYGFKTYQSNNPILSAVDSKGIHEDLKKKYGVVVVIISVTSQGRVYV